jgi:hypothetical protein
MVFVLPLNLCCSGAKHGKAIGLLMIISLFFFFFYFLNLFLSPTMLIPKPLLYIQDIVCRVEIHMFVSIHP